MDVRKEEKIEEPKKLNAISDPYKLVPKFCNGVNFAVIGNYKIIITFTYKEGDTPPVIIERVMVDADHAKKIHKVLGEVLERISKNGKPK